MSRVRHPEKGAVIVCLLGGLGNQLFQLSFARFLAQSSKRDPIFFVGLQHKAASQHGSGLTSLAQTTPLMRYSSSRWDGLRTRIGLRVPSSSTPTWRRSGLFRVTEFTEVGYPEGYAFENDRNGHIYFGYVQTYRFTENKRDFRALIKGDTPDQAFGSSDSQVALHVRRGDYLTALETFGVLDFDYYRAAIEQLHCEDPIEEVVVFGTREPSSQGLIDRLKVHFSTINFRFRSDAVELATPAEDLLFISSFRRIIISNSSFAWWAAYLSEDAQVLAPSKWFRGMPDPQDLIPPEWTRAPSAWLVSSET